MEIKAIGILVGVSALFIGCAPASAPPGGSGGKGATAQAADPSSLVAAGNEKSLFPFAQGNSWTFAVDIQRQLTGRPKEQSTSELEYRVLSVAKDGSFTKATLGIFQDGKQKDQQVWGADEHGIYQMAMNPPGGSLVPYSPKQPILHFPIKDQEEFSWNGSGVTPVGKPGKMEYKYKLDGTADADTEMGSMHCVYMQTAGKFTNSDGTVGILGVNSWYSPGVGLARYRQVIQIKGGESSVTLRLKKYTVKK
ncbi:MAG: hypothetical protein JST51_13990 [Armatimonadetes bacterium]|nr:hypothetical protein [Armatimonadota bacterium]